MRDMDCMDERVSMRVVSPQDVCEWNACVYV